MLTAARGMGLQEKDFAIVFQVLARMSGARKIDQREDYCKWQSKLTDRWRSIGRQRINFDRLRKERLDKAKAELKKSEMGALLVFDMNNVRYLTATTIGTWAQDKISRFALLAARREATSRSCGTSVPPPSITS